MDTYAFPHASPRQDRDELFRLAGWVVEVFDRATLQAAENAEALDEHLAAANAEALAIAQRIERQPALSGSAIAHHHNQMRRLSQLAPAAIAWVARHAQSANQDRWDEFRHHLVGRCEAIIRECPHPALSDE